MHLLHRACPAGFRSILVRGLAVVVLFLSLLDFSGQGNIPGAGAASNNQKPLSTGDGSWNWLSPNLQGNTLKSISCPTLKGCVTVGENGTILRTFDGGATWSSAPSTLDSYNNNLQAVSCALLIDCYITTDKGKVLHSNIAFGGAKINAWTIQQAGVGNDSLTGITCPATGHCLAVDDYGYATRTSNAGASWEHSIVQLNIHLNAVSCETQKRCVAVGNGGLSFITVDFGTNWYPASVNNPTNEDLMSVSCLSNGCYAVGAAGSILQADQVIGVWTKQAQFGPLYSISCPASQACFAVGANRQVVSTPNAGFNWSAAALNTPGMTNFSVACPGISVCYAVGQNGSILIYNGQGWTASNDGTFPDFKAVLCSTAKICYAAGQNGLLLQTLDAGKSWTKIAVPQFLKPFVKDFTGIACPQSLYCYLTTNNGTVITYRFVNGVDQLKLDFGAANVAGGLSFNGVACTDASTCFVVGNNGVIFRRWDMGSGQINWVKIASGTTQNLNATTCMSATVCLAVGNYGTTLRTLNANYIVPKWTVNDSSTAKYSSDLKQDHADLKTIFCWLEDCYVAANAWAFYEGYQIGDETMNWTRQTLPGTPLERWNTTIRSVSCNNAIDCVAVGKTGQIFAVIGSGKEYSWAKQNSGLSRELYGVSCQGGNCLAVGSTATIITRA